MNNLVSVIITTYNRRSFLKEAVFSVVNQDYQNKEIIVIDDGSTDESVKEIDGLPVKYIWKKNGGISSARNKGIEVAQGDYIAFLDVDDLWKNGKLAVQMKRMMEEGFLISYTDEIWIRNGKRMNQKLKHRKYSGYIFEKCLPLCIISPSSVVIKREMFDKVGLFDESMPVCEDYDLWLRISAQYPVLFIEQPLIVKRGGHDDQLSKSYEAMDKFRIQSLANLLNSGILDETQKIKAAEELKTKCLIVANGAKKRGKSEEAEHYLRLADIDYMYPVIP
ncbi:MAG: glycosyltransferase [Proteobacteria bacterium]|nr:glycosyltransferase [Pseudomonadota bacterium]